MNRKLLYKQPAFVQMDNQLENQLIKQQAINTCDEFHFLEMDFVPIGDPEELIFVSDTEEYLVTKSETAWLFQSILDDELIMFGLTGTSSRTSKPFLESHFAYRCGRTVNIDIFHLLEHENQY